HRLLTSEPEGWLRRSDFPWQPPGRRLAAPGTPGEKLFDDTILKRMKSHHGKPAVLLEDRLGSGERMHQFAKLVVDRDAQRLERARRRVHLARFAWRHAGDHCSEHRRRGERRRGAARDDGMGDMAGRTLLAKMVK